MIHNYLFMKVGYLEYNHASGMIKSDVIVSQSNGSLTTVIMNFKITGSDMIRSDVDKVITHNRFY